MSEAEAIRALARSVELFRRGVFCRAELWRHVADRVAGQGVSMLLDALPPELQRVLREAYRDWPPSLETGVVDEAIRGEIESWSRHRSRS